MSLFVLDTNCSLSFSKVIQRFLSVARRGNLARWSSP